MHIYFAAYFVRINLNTKHYKPVSRFLFLNFNIRKQAYINWTIEFGLDMLILLHIDNRLDFMDKTLSTLLSVIIGEVLII